MRKEYNFSKAQPTPYTRVPKKAITIRIDEDTVDYFKELSEDVGLPYQTLVNLYLRDCAESRRKLEMKWIPKSKSS